MPVPQSLSLHAQVQEVAPHMHPIMLHITMKRVFWSVAREMAAGVETEVPRRAGEQKIDGLTAGRWRGYGDCLASRGDAGRRQLLGRLATAYSRRCNGAAARVPTLPGSLGRGAGTGNGAASECADAADPVGRLERLHRDHEPPTAGGALEQRIAGEFLEAIAVVGRGLGREHAQSTSGPGGRRADRASATLGEPRTGAACWPP